MKSIHTGSARAAIDIVSPSAKASTRAAVRPIDGSVVGKPVDGNGNMEMPMPETCWTVTVQIGRDEIALDVGEPIRSGVN